MSTRLDAEVDRCVGEQNVLNLRVAILSGREKSTVTREAPPWLCPTARLPFLRALIFPATLR